MPSLTGDKCEAEDDADQDDLAGREPKFTLTIPFDSEKIDNATHCQYLRQFVECSVRTHIKQYRQHRQQRLGYRPARK